MTQFEKFKIKEKLKSEIKLLIGSGAFLVVGIIIFIVGSVMSGANIVEWFTSPFAITFYIIIGICLIVLGYAILGLWVFKKGGKNNE